MHFPFCFLLLQWWHNFPCLWQSMIKLSVKYCWDYFWVHILTSWTEQLPTKNFKSFFRRMKSKKKSKGELIIFLAYSLASWKLWMMIIITVWSNYDSKLSAAFYLKSTDIPFPTENAVREVTKINSIFFYF